MFDVWVFLTKIQIFNQMFLQDFHCARQELGLLREPPMLRNIRFGEQGSGAFVPSRGSRDSRFHSKSCIPKETQKHFRTWTTRTFSSIFWAKFGILTTFSFTASLESNS